jgi:hypothetical protein
MGAALALFLNSKILVEPQFSGMLLPGDEPSPPLPRMPPQISIPDDALRLHLGGMTAVTASDSCRVLMIDGQSIVSIRRRNSGILVSAKVFSADGRIVAEIDDNEFHLNPNNFFRRERPNKSELTVFDQQGTEVLRVKFLNPHTFRIFGRFPTRQGTLIAAEGVTQIGRNRFSNAFFGFANSSTGAAFVIGAMPTQH